MLAVSGFDFQSATIIFQYQTKQISEGDL